MFELLKRAGEHFLVCRKPAQLRARSERGVNLLTNLHAIHTHTITSAHAPAIDLTMYIHGSVHLRP
jgi:hypothetical protein